MSYGRIVLLVRPAGFEPTTSTFGTSCSIRVSCGRLCCCGRPVQSRLRHAETRSAGFRLGRRDLGMEWRVGFMVRRILAACRRRCQGESVQGVAPPVRLERTLIWVKARCLYQLGYDGPANKTLVEGEGIEPSAFPLPRFSRPLCAPRGALRNNSILAATRGIEPRRIGLQPTALPAELHGVLSGARPGTRTRRKPLLRRVRLPIPPAARIL